MRTRVRLLVQLTTRYGRYRRGLVQAAKSLTPEEAAVLADLEAHGLDVNQLRDVLWGGHVLVDEHGPADPGHHSSTVCPQTGRSFNRLLRRAGARGQPAGALLCMAQESPRLCAGE